MNTSPSANQPKSSGRQTLFERIELHAEKRPDAPALLTPGCPALSYQRLKNHITVTVRQLQQFGFDRGNRLAVVLPNGPELATTFLALSSNTTCAPLNPAYSPAELEFYLRATRSQALVVTVETERIAGEAARGLGLPVIHLVPENKEAAGLFRLEVEKGLLAPKTTVENSEEIGLVLHTSGTTGKAKIVPLSRVNLFHVGKNIADALELTQSDCGLNFMPLFHLHGLGVVMSALYSGGSMVCASEFEAALFFGWLKEFRPTWYSAAPSFHQSILARAKAAHPEIVPTLRLIRTGSAHLPMVAFRELEKVFNAPVIEFWGLSESGPDTCNGLASAGRRAGSVGRAVGAEVGVVDEYGKTLGVGAIGEVVVRGPNVISGYENNPEANQKSFFDGWFRTGDHGYIDADGFLFISGRLKEVINRGGEKIIPGEIDDVLSAHPAIAEVAAFGFPDQRLGEEVGVVVAPRAGCSISVEDVREFAAQRLAEFKVPRQVSIVSKIPKNATGKLERLKLAAVLGLTDAVKAQAPIGSAYVPPETELERQLVEIWKQVLRLDKVGTADNFFSLGGQSLLAVRMFTQIKEATGKDLPLVTLFEAPTIKQLCEILRQERWQPTWTSLVPLKIDGSKPPFYCVHGIGGNILEFHDMLRHVEADQPVYGIQAQGLDGKNPRHKTVEEMAGHYIKEIRELQPEGPYYLGGSSFGGLVAYEVAQQLSVKGLCVGILIMFDTRAPGYPKWPPGTPAWKKRLSRWKFRFDLHWSNLRMAKGRAKLEYFSTKANRLWNRRWRYRRLAREYVQRKIDELLHPRAIREVRQAGHQANKAYQPKPYSGKITLLRAKEQPKGIQEDRTNGWSAYALGGLDVHEVPGHHGSIMREPRARVLIEKLTACLNEAYQPDQQFIPLGSGSAKSRNSAEIGPREPFPQYSVNQPR
jgi:oxalate---CoA ligase